MRARPIRTTSSGEYFLPSNSTSPKLNASPIFVTAKPRFTIANALNLLAICSLQPKGYSTKDVSASDKYTASVAFDLIVKPPLSGTTLEGKYKYSLLILSPV